MGGDGRRAEGLPVSLKVKNTFIDVNSSFVEDDADDMAFQHSMFRKRQVSEPVPCIQRQISGPGGQYYRTAVEGRSPVTAGLPPDGLLEEEELDGDELDGDGEEPETEKDPCFVLGRQESELAWSSMPPMRQETEQCWPSWGPPASSSTGMGLGEVQPMMVHPKDGGSAADMWMFQMPGMGGNHADPADLGLADGAVPHTALAAALNSSPWPGLANPFAVHGDEPSGLGDLHPGPDLAAGAFGGASERGGAQGDVMPGSELTPAALASAAMGGLAVPPPEWANTSTVMMRNLPNKYTQQMLLEELNQSGYQNTFDFMYLPIDPETHANRGYAFINFIDPSFAWMLKMSYEGRKMTRFNSDKVVSVAPAALQGFEANYAHYSTARVNRGDPAARPLFLCESRMRHLAPRHDGGRRRGGRRSSGSLIDLAARQQQQQVAMAAVPNPLQGLTGTTGATEADGGSTFFSDTGAAKGAGKRATPAEQQSGPKFCPYCGGKCQPQFRFCQFCGASLNLTTM